MTEPGPRCYAHDSDPSMLQHGHFAPQLGVPAHTWGSGPSGEPGCRRCGGHFVNGDQYVCEPDGIVHITCPDRLDAAPTWQPPWSDPDHDVAGDFRAGVKEADDAYTASLDPAPSATQALRDAADALEGGLGVPGMPRNLWEFRQWLRDRADRLDAAPTDPGTRRVEVGDAGQAACAACDGSCGVCPYSAARLRTPGTTEEGQG